MSDMVFMTYVLFWFTLGGSVVYFIVRGINRGDVSRDLQLAVSSDNANRVRAILVAQHRWLDRRQISQAEAFIAEKELAEEELHELRLQQERQRYQPRGSA